MRDAGMHVVSLYCGWLLTCVVCCAAATAVTHGDLMLSSSFDQALRVQVRAAYASLDMLERYLSGAAVDTFYSPQGKLKATFGFKSCTAVWARAISQDGRSGHVRRKHLLGMHAHTCSIHSAAYCLWNRLESACQPLTSTLTRCCDAGRCRMTAYWADIPP
jgi:hypothetical protein